MPRRHFRSQQPQITRRATRRAHTPRGACATQTLTHTYAARVVEWSSGKLDHRYPVARVESARIQFEPDTRIAYSSNAAFCGRRRHSRVSIPREINHSPGRCLGEIPQEHEAELSRERRSTSAPPCRRRSHRCQSRSSRSGERLTKNEKSHGSERFFWHAFWGL